MAARFRIHQKFLSEVTKPEEKAKEEVIVLEDGQDSPKKEEKEKPKRKAVKVGGLMMRKNVSASFM
jgi:hypothetical protein